MANLLPLILNFLKNFHTNEPILSWGTLAALFNVLTLIALPVAPWVHILIVAVAQLTAMLAARRKTVPAGSPQKVARALAQFK